MKTHSLFRLLSLVVVALCWSGCASGPPPRDHFYRLEVAKPPASGEPRIRGTLEVERMQVEALSQGRRILYRSEDRPGEVAQYAYHQWSDPPSLMLRDRLVDYLRAAGVAKAVTTPAFRVTADFVASGRILRFEQLIEGNGSRVVVELELVLTRTNGRELVFLGDYHEERAAGSIGVSDAVQAFEEAVAAIFARFVADLPEV
jgi:cholesterol transport system auxiliary component